MAITHISSNPSAVTHPIVPTAIYAGCPVARYQRWRILPRLVQTSDIDMREPAFDVVTSADLAATLIIAARLDVALKRETRRAQHNHWSYDNNRWQGLKSALDAERWIAKQQTAKLFGAVSAPRELEAA